MIFHLARLSADQLESLQALENSTGHTILAMQALPGEPAQLTEAQLAQLQQTEKELGLTLVAVEG